MSTETQITAHDDFDWTVDKRNVTKYSDEKHAEMEKMYEGSFKDIEDGTVIYGTIQAVTPNDVILNIGYKSDGVVPLSEFRGEMEDIKPGNIVEVYVDAKENAKGQLVLSRKKARQTKAWDKIKEAHEQQYIVTGNILTKTKGGLIVNVFGIETFLPGSQIDVKPVTDYDQYVGKAMEFKVVKINEIIKNAVVSHKAIIESDMEEQRGNIMSKLEKGQILEGVIKNITDFGAFMDLGGVDGLLYITDISWGRINHPSEVLTVNEKINVCVLDFDDNKKRISLGLKQLQPHPWTTVGDEYEVGKLVKGKIVNVEDYGAFLEIVPGIEGLIHVSEVSWSNEPINSKDFFKLGDEMEATVVTVEKEDRKMSLSLKRMTTDPWEKIAEQYPVGSKHTGIVKNLTPYGVFVELNDGIGGMVHISDLSWTKRYTHPSEFTKVGKELEVVVLEIDKENRKLSLGHKQIESDPWDSFQDSFPLGSVHSATIIKKDDKGAIVALPYGIEGFCPGKQLKKEDGAIGAVDETLDFRIIEFSRDEKRIIVSHSKIWEERKRAEKATAENEVVKENTKTKKALASQKIEKTTLGDLDVLSALKEKMDKGEK